MDEFPDYEWHDPHEMRPGEDDGGPDIPDLTLSLHFAFCMEESVILDLHYDNGKGGHEIICADTLDDAMATFRTFLMATKKLYYSKIFEPTGEQIWKAMGEVEKINCKDPKVDCSKCKKDCFNMYEKKKKGEKVD